MERTGPMIRCQILLTPAQRQRLEQYAQREGRSLSDVVRRALDIGLDALDGHSEQALQRQLAALDELTKIREEVEARYGVYKGDPVRESWEERERDRERIWKGE